MHFDLIQLILVTGSWSGALVGLITYLHTRRANMFEKLKERMAEVETSAQRDHKALAAQLADTNLTIAERYVRRNELKNEFAHVETGLREMAGNIDKVHRRIDELFQRVEWRRENSNR